AACRTEVGVQRADACASLALVLTRRARAQVIAVRRVVRVLALTLYARVIRAQVVIVTLGFRGALGRAAHTGHASVVAAHAGHAVVDSTHTSHADLGAARAARALATNVGPAA